MAPTDVGGATRDAARFESLISDASERFGLGASAGPLVREALAMITGGPGGVAGFLNKFESAGFASQLASCLGRGDAPAMSEDVLRRVLGPSTIDGLARRLGLSQATASTALAYILPKMIGALTPGGTIPPESTTTRRTTETYVERPRAETTSTRAAATETTTARPRFETAERTRPRVEATADEPYLSRWLWPLLGTLALLGLGWYLLSANRPAPTVPVATPAPVPPAAQAPAQLPRLTLSNENGVARISGAVHDEESRNAILNALKAVFGADNIQGDVSVDPNRAAAPWLVNFRTAVEALRVPGVQAEFDGRSVNLGGLLNDADRERITTSLRNTLGSNLVFGALGDRVAGLAANANTAVTSALSALRPGFSANDLVGILNQSIINFRTGSAEVPPAAISLLQSAAVQFKQLPAGTVVEIAGHTDNTGDPAANVKLSQERADAVRNALVEAGVDPARLLARGYGSAHPIASNDDLEGRFRNRRIEYRVTK